jgi:selenocysteine-specific elongation factor
VGADAPIVVLDSITGAGLEDLVTVLERAVDASTVPDRGRPRMWVDRSFIIAGAGIVVTGTLLDGPVAVGDELAVFPGGNTARVRGIHSHEQPRDRVAPGSRAALNLSGLETNTLTRGAMLGRPGEWVPTRRMLVSLRTVRSLAAPIKDRGAYHLHVGSGSWPARLRLLDGADLTGAGHAVITTGEAIPLAMGDRFILREVGRRAVVAGGRILEPMPPERIRSVDRARLDRLVDAAPDEQAAALLASRGSSPVAVLSAHSRGGTAVGAPVGAGIVVDPAEAARLSQEAVAGVEEYQSANPLRPGMPTASLASRLGIGRELLAVLLAHTDGLAESGATVATTGFAVQLDPRQEQAWEAARARLAAGLAVPALGELGLPTELVYALVRAGSLVRISQDLVYLPDQVERIVTGLAELPPGFTVAQFRDHFGLTRKYAVPLLEWLDAEGHTVRNGNGRTATGR